MMIPTFLTVLSAFLASTSAAAVERRDRTCTVELSEQRGQNAVGGGDNSLTCGVSLDYGDGRQDILSEACNQIWHAGDHCFSSQLPYSICIHTNGDKDGYLNYSNEHRDFNEDGCSQDSSASIGGDAHTITCTFPCT
ncbi:hypothetical protein BDV37DRAFT_256662 [Aspergillus pseudonomiae]|uniref:Cyanovirin-N domain-containing protein n=2 Tax=Aspergillus subgen. Circumdati TaxID=2720871 RepID=A0A0L1JC50_ASPN3|nr:uncharacterized protein ANOM_001637 [Aspergillus nomiae NRRL 13137]XP_031938083.1 uncharacterized protein BDV37DRAFT_256662 [Aspergillus pseudonomiae]KAE8400764.1 hypothetical protein BDV37DRAFT_256662 [Aspergillus pseudonomiae]KNG89307.1 hypothetical protein ANOM_001637 [Aspergillus nomiae NRRL 13137]